MPSYTNETGFPVLAVNTSGEAVEVADDGTFQSYNYYPDLTMSASTPNPTVKTIDGGCLVIFNLTGKADGSVDDVAFPTPVMNLIMGHKLAGVEVVPGAAAAAPTSAFAVTLTNANALQLCTKADCATDAVSEIDASDLVTSAITLSCGDIGQDNTAQVIVRTEAR